MIYCVWYPSGGFGHFINAVLTLYGQGFKRPNASLSFSDTGNSHHLDLVLPKYFKDPENYILDFNPDFHYSVLIDNGITNEGDKFKKFFPQSVIIKITYSDWSWPIIADTMIVKAMESDFDQGARSNSDRWSTSEDWAVRENYFLYLRDNMLRHKWKSPHDISVDIFDIIDYKKLISRLSEFGIVLSNFESDHDKFFKANELYILPVTKSLELLEAVKLNKKYSLDYFNGNLWAQSIVYYYIWLEYNVEVPHNDYSNWFTSVNDIVTMLDNHGVTFDSN